VQPEKTPTYHNRDGETEKERGDDYMLYMTQHSTYARFVERDRHLCSDYELGYTVFYAMCHFVHLTARLMIIIDA